MSLFDTDAVPYGPSARTVFDEGNSRTFSFIAIAAAATFAACALSLRQLLQYVHKIQPCTPRTLAIVLVCVPPLFSISSMMGLISPRGNGLFQLIRASATVMASFAYFKLIFWHVGGVTAAVTKITAKMGNVKDHWLTKIPLLIPLRLCVPKIRMTGRFLSRCRA
jgi:choline-glycine betaine transporter